MTHGGTTRWRYCCRIVSTAFEDFHWGRDLVIATAIATATALAQVFYKLVPHDKKTVFLETALVPYAVVLGAHIIFRLLSAPWKLHREAESTVAQLQQALADKARELQEYEVASESLSARVQRFTDELVAFLREKGDRPPDPGLNESMSFEERTLAVVKTTHPWVDAIAFGYDHRFKQRAQDLLAELREYGINSGIEDYDVEPPHGQNAEGIRILAEKLAKIRIDLDLREQQASVAHESVVASADWQELATRFDKYAAWNIRADWQRSSLGAESWRISGVTGGADKNCEALCKLAGAMLLRSPKICAELSETAQKEKDLASRWFYYLKDSYGLDHTQYAIEQFDDGQRKPLYWGSINQLGAVSSRACIECSAKEI